MIYIIRKIKKKASVFKTILKPIFPIYRKIISLKRFRVSDFGTFKYNIDLKEYIDSELYFNGYFEQDITEVINNITGHEMTVLDIGANTGVHTLRFASLVGYTGRVYAFEPTEFAFNRLKNNINLNSFENIIAEKLALSDGTSKNQNIEFRSSWNLDSLDNPLVINEFVNFYTLDDYVLENKITKIDIIKIDIDGFEYLALKGGINSLNKFKPKIIIELSRNLDGSASFQEYIQFLLDLRYEFIFPSLSDKKSYKISRYR